LFTDASDIKAAIAALSFIIANGAKYNVEDGVLSNELQQLGLPKGSSMISWRSLACSLLFFYALKSSVFRAR
jgi:hypothetical protein